MKPLAYLFVPAMLFAQPAFSQLSSSGESSASENQPYDWCTVCAGSVWDSTSNINETDGQYSDVLLKPYLQCIQGNCYWSRYLVGYHYDFDIPFGATINGIEVHVKGFADADQTVMDSTVKLRRNSNYLSGTNHAKMNSWSDHPDERVYGGPDDLWGESWTSNDINSSDFGLYLKLYNPSNLDVHVSVDQMSVTVYYSITTGIYSETSTPKPFRIFEDAQAQTLNVFFSQDENNSTSKELRIIDMNGRVVYSEAGMNVEEHQISTSDLAQGLYTCVMIAGGKLYSEKFLVTDN